jgi:hypothetical protein
MRSVRTVVGLVALVCAFCAFASVASAKAPKEEKFFGEFVATRASAPVSEADPGKFKGTGEVEELANIGGYKLQDCKLTAQGNVTQERSKEFYATLKVKCTTFSSPEGETKTKEAKKVHFSLGVEYNANKSAEFGEPNEGEFHIVQGSGVIAKISSSKCKVEIPSQYVPLRAGKNTEDEFEAVEYETESEPVEGQGVKTYPSGFHKTLDIDWELKKIHSILIVDGEKCQHTEGGKILPSGDVEYANGRFIGDLEELSLQKGNLEFDEEPPVVEEE